MSNYYLCDTCAVPHIGGETQTFVPYFLCSVRKKPLEGMLVISDNEEPSEICPAYKAKELD